MDEEYSPDTAVESLKFDLRREAAHIAAQIPWNASEAVTEESIRTRFNVVYEWLAGDIPLD